MVRVGWMQDTHIAADDSAGAGSTFQSNLDDLFSTYGCEDWWHTGDAAHPPNQAVDNVPHLPDVPATYDNIFGYINGAGRYGELQALLPSHHDAPYQRVLDYDEKCKRRHSVAYEDGVTVILLDTSGGSTVTGSPGADGDQGGSGVDYGYVPYNTLQWLDAELSDAASRGDAKVVLPHHLLYPPDGTGQGADGADNRGLSDQQSYWIVQNTVAVHDILSQYSKVVVPQSHWYQFASEGSRTVDGVTYAWKEHYHNVNLDTNHTYGYIDASSTHCDVVTVNQSGTTNTIVSEAY